MNWGSFITKGIEWSWSSRWNFIFPYQFHHWRSSSLHANLVTSLMNGRPCIYPGKPYCQRCQFIYLYIHIYIMKACVNRSHRASVAGGHIWDANQLVLPLAGTYEHTVMQIAYQCRLSVYIVLTVCVLCVWMWM